MNPRQIWDKRFAGLNKTDIERIHDPWLECWLPLLETIRNVPLLELGCGGGSDTRYLSDKGFQVFGVDFSREALQVARLVAPEATLAQVDLRYRLPFPGGIFQVILASLCLHYFHWEQTREILDNVRNCLRVGGFLFARFNSIRDDNYGAVGHPAVEPNLFLVRGVLKRFFSRADLDQLFLSGWELRSIEEKVIQRFSQPKVVWEVVVMKAS